MNKAKLEAYIFDKMSSARMPGLSIALVKGDRVVYTRGFGLSDIAHGRAAEPETLYPAASITKSFTAVAILQLAQRGLLHLADPVGRHVRWPVKSAGGPVRIQHLLTHTSGLPALAYAEAVIRHANQLGGRRLPIGGPRDVLTFMRGANSWAECPPGRRWFYLNEGYVMLGRIVERVSGQPYDEYIREEILKPLGMSRSFFAEKEILADGRLAVPYVIEPGVEPRVGNYSFGVFSTDGGLVTNVLDLARYVSMFLRHGRGVLSLSSWRAMTRPRVSSPARPIPGLWGPKEKPVMPARYAYGLSVSDDFFGETLIGHSGSVLVATGYFGFLPRSRIGVAVLANSKGCPMVQVGKVALALMRGKDPETLTFARTDRVMEDLCGVYETYRGTLRVRIARDGDFLRLEYVNGPPGTPPAQLVPACLDGCEPRFFTYGDGQRLDVEFRKTRGGVELIFERYKLRRTGPSA
jgi:CubicO group peptidase (beta-lactamase class C family)